MNEIKENCLFCNVVHKREHSFIIYEDRYNIVILDKFPKSLGHVLVIPKSHSDDFLKTSDDELKNTIVLSKRVAIAIDKAFKPDGLRYISNIRSAGGQVIFHTHFHIIPIYLKKQDIVINEDIRDKIKSHLMM